jgi:hypothetical protein
MEKNSNIDLIYQYTASLLKEQGDSLNRLDTKLSAFLGFGGLTLRFALNLPSKPWHESLQNPAYLSCLILKVITCILAGACVFICAFGLTASLRGIAVDPKELMDDEWFQREEEICKGYIISAWIKITDEFEIVGKRKGQTLNIAIWCISIAIIAFAANIAISTIYIQ